MINFPKHHLADEVIARIVMNAKRAQAESNSVKAQGMQLDQALQQPIGDVAPMEGIEDAITLKALNL